MRYLLLTTTALGAIWATPACADPIITPIVTAVIASAAGVSTATAAGFTIAGISVVGLATAAVEIGLSFGASLLLSPRRKSTYDPSLPPQPTLQSINAQSISPRYYGAGRIMVGGIEPWKECEDGLHCILSAVLNCEPIDGIEAYLVDGENITSWESGPFTMLTAYTLGYAITVDCGPDVIWPSAGLKYTFQYVQRWTGSRFEPYPAGVFPAMVFDFRQGLSTGNPSPLAAHFMPTLYDTARHKNIYLPTMFAMAVGGQVILDRMRTYPRAWPQMTWVIRATTIYDPRDTDQTFDSTLTADSEFITADSGITVDSTDIAAAPLVSRRNYVLWYFAQKETWTWSRNAVLVVAWYLTHYDGCRRPVSKIRWDQVATEATYCDRPVTTYGGGTEPWACIDAQWHAGEQQRDVLARLSAACDLTVWEDGEGMLNFWIAKDETPTVTITDDDISSIEISELSPALDEINYITPSYVEARENYQVIPGPTVTDDESIGLVGERPETVTFREVESFNQAYRLAYRLLKRRNPTMRVTITGGPSLLRCVGERVVTVSSDTTGVTGTFRFEKRSDTAPDLTQITLHLARVGANDYDDVVPPYDPVSPNESSTAPVPPGVTIQKPDAPVLSQVTISSDEYLQSTAQVSGATPTDTSLLYFVEARLVDGSHDPLGAWFDLDTVVSQWVRETSSLVTVGEIYEARSWFTQNGRPSQMSDSSFRTIT